LKSELSQISTSKLYPDLSRFTMLLCMLHSCGAR